MATSDEIWCNGGAVGIGCYTAFSAKFLRRRCVVAETPRNRLWNVAGARGTPAADHFMRASGHLPL